MARTIKVEGLEDVIKRLNFDVLVQPEMQDAADTIVARMMRGGKGKGVKNNTLSKRPITNGLGAEVHSTLNYPRRSGRKWGQYQEKVVKGIVARNAVKKAVERIGARWAGEVA